MRVVIFFYHVPHFRDFTQSSGTFSLNSGSIGVTPTSMCSYNRSVAAYKPSVCFGC